MTITRHVAAIAAIGEFSGREFLSQEIAKIRSSIDKAVEHWLKIRFRQCLCRQDPLDAGSFKLEVTR
jgi:hypothetical protein